MGIAQIVCLENGRAAARDLALRPDAQHHAVEQRGRIPAPCEDAAQYVARHLWRGRLLSGIGIDGFGQQTP